MSQVRLHPLLGCGLAAVLFSVGAAAQHQGMPMPAASQHQHSFSFGAPAHAGDVARTVRITMGDMSFTPSRVEVRAGEVVRFVLTNASAIDHEFILGDAATQEAHRAEMTRMAMEGQSMAHHADPNTMSVKAGTTEEMVWKFGPAQSLEYGCNIPGHYESGMKGAIVVR